VVHLKAGARTCASLPDKVDLPPIGYCPAKFMAISCARIDPTPRSSRIDTATAMASPGVLAVFSAEHVIKAGFKSPRPILHFKGKDDSVIKVPPRPALAHERVRFVGEAVALVVAETEAAAQDAAQRLSSTIATCRS
jgi:CO/xanthine dehydrogenase Mo-binding subunit